MYQQHVLSYKHLDEPLNEGRFVFEIVFWQRTSKPLLSIVFHFEHQKHVPEAID